MNLFEEIESAKKDLPKVKSLGNDLRKKSFNLYQILAIGMFLISLCLGIFFGNLFATCEAKAYFYSDRCLNTEFNFSLMILIWFGGFLLSLFVYAIGHIIALLQKIDEKLSNFKL